MREISFKSKDLKVFLHKTLIINFTQKKQGRHHINQMIKVNNTNYETY